MNLSLCCISKSLSDEGHRFKTMTYTQFCKKSQDESMNELCARILHNFKITHRTIKYCQENYIQGYRLSSSLAPVLTHKNVNLKISDLPNYPSIVQECESIQQTLQKQYLRISAHPSEYITLSSLDENCIKNSILDLEQHAEIFELLGLPKSYQNPLNIHIRQDGDPVGISKRVMKVYDSLPNSVRNRLVIENNDNAKGVWSIKNLLKYFPNIPITFDTLHHKLLSDDWTHDYAFHSAADSWTFFTPLFHYSEGIVEKGKETRKHADMPTSYPTNYNRPVFWDVELKHKCHAIFKIRQLAANNL